MLITTGVDALVRLVKEKQRVELEEAAAVLNIPEQSIEDWARVLEEQGILRIEYRLTKVYLTWIKPTAEEIATEKESFYEEKDDIQGQVEEFKKKMAARNEEIQELQKSFSDFYEKTHAKMEQLEKVVLPVPAGELISEGTFTKGEQELAVMRSELNEIRSALGDIKNEFKDLGVEKGDSESKKAIEKLEAVHSELAAMQDEIKEIKRKAAAETPSDVAMPSMRDIRAKLESLKKDFSSLKARNSRLREDMISLHESSQILNDVAESIMGQEEKIGGIRKEVQEVSAEADKLLKKAQEVAEKTKQNLEVVERLGDSVTVARGIVKRFPNQEKVMKELEGLKEGEKDLSDKYQSIEKLISAVGGKQVSAKQFAEISRKMDIKMEQMRRDMDTLETALEDEKGTYLTFQKIKERIVPSVTAYERKLGEMEQRITEIGKEALAQKESLKTDAKKLQASMKEGDMKKVMKVAEEISSKKKMLDDIRTSFDELVDISDNLSKRITLLSREAKLLEIRAGEGAPVSEEEEKGIRNQIDLTKEEELEFRRKREELKKLIKRLWEE